MASFSPSRRKHRKRFSLSHLSSDTSATLPEYSSVIPPVDRDHDDLPYDRPPEYPQSADEADADTDSSADSAASHISPLPLSPTHQRRFRAPSHRRSTSVSNSTDPFLDSLLERSVHALEMSNALLQSSMSTHSSLSTFLASEPSTAADQALEASARGLSSRISRISSNRAFHESWMDDIDCMSRDVDGLLDVPDEGRDAVSRSLPTSSPMHSRMRAHGHRHRSSTDLPLHGCSSALSSSTDLTLPDPAAPHLRLRPPSRDQLVAPAPRAMTLYVESDADPSTISLPSTLGLRSSSSTTFLPQHTDESHRPPNLSPPRAGSSQASISKSPPLAIPRRKDRPQPASESSTPAYTLLSSFLSRRPSTSTACPSTSQKFSSMLRNRSASARRASTGTTRSPRGSPARRRASMHRRPSTSASFSDSPSLSRSPPPPPLQLAQTPEIRLAPALEDLISRSSSESSSSLEQPVQSMQALRKILDDQPPSPSTSRDTSQSTERARLRKEFMPVTPIPAPTLGTSTATASVSRLFTKGVHANSTRPRSPPKHSALKGSSGATTPRTPRSPEGTSWAAGPSGSVSGTSTPRRIQFAELPEPYSRERGSSGRGFDKGRGKGKGKARAKAGTGLSTSTGEESEDEPTWWQAWLGIDPVKDRERAVTEERVEARAARWGLAGGGRGFGAVDDWGL